MKRIFSSLMVCLVMIAALFVSAAPAQAETYVERRDSNCWVHEVFLVSTHRVCMGISTREWSVRGIEVYDIDLWCSGGPWENTMPVNGQFLEVRTPTGLLRWRMGDGDSNIPQDNPCSRDYAVHFWMNNSNWGQMYYEFKPRYDNQPDPGTKFLGVIFAD